MGPAATSKELSIPISTITHWQRLSRDNKKAAAPAPVAAEAGPEVVEKKRVADRKAGEPPTASEASPEVVEKKRMANRKTGEPTPTTSEASPEVVKKKRVAKVYTPSQRKEAIELAARIGPAAAGRELGISRFSIYDWQRRTALHAEGKASTSPVVGSDEDKAAARDHLILGEWRSHPGLGPSQVRNQLRRQGRKVSIHTVRCVLEENGYVTPKVRHQTGHDRRYEAVRPNQLVHLDFLHRHINKQMIYTLLLLDDWSRFIVGGAMWDGERVAAVEETFMEAVNRHGKPEKAMSDGGSAFYAWKGVGQFTRLLEELEVDQIIAKIPQVNGKLEVLNANIQKELFDQQRFFDLGEAQRRLLAWIDFYNFRRTHHALGGVLVPADRYFGRADKVLACIEAGGCPDGIGEPTPTGDRHLDLFRICSHRGQVELHLLGHRIPLPIVK
jgi:transposase InsO family protein